MKALKILATFAFITLFFSLPPSFAESLKADSKILEVTVFPDRALVTRQAQLDLPAGSHEIKLEGLSGLIFEDSVSAKGEGNAKVKLFGARLITSQLTDAQPPRLQELEKQIRELRAQQQSIDSRKKIAKAKEEFLNSIKAASGEQIGKDLVTKQPSVSDAENLLKMLDTQLTSIYESSRNADEEIQALGREIDRLQRELNQLQEEYRRNAQQNTIAVDVEAESSGKFTLQVAYQVPKAS